MTETGTMRRAWRVGSALAAVSMAAAACSSSKPAARPPSSSSRAPLPTFPTLPSTTVTPNAAADRATAEAVNLRAADLPGWSASPNSSNRSDRAMNAQMARCAGADDPAVADVVDVYSDNFDQGQAEVNSDVTMVRDLAEGRKDLQALESSRLPSCVQQVVEPYLKTQLPSGTSLSGLSFEPRPAPTGIPDSFAFRFVVQVTQAGQGTVTVDVDQLGFLQGRAEVELTDTVTGAGPDAALEQHLVTVLFDRARSQPGTA